MLSSLFGASRPEVAAPADATNGKSLAFLDGARALAALFVVAHHVYLHPPGVDRGLDIYGWQGAEKMLGLLWWGHFAVTFFIVLSGFCLAIGPARRDALPSAREFLWRRARRILPPYFGALALSLILIWVCIGVKTGTHWDTSLPVTLRSLVCRLVLVNAFNPDDGLINHVFWSIAVEWHLYFCFLPLLLLVRLFRWRNVLLVLTPAVFLTARVAQNRLGDDFSLAFLALFVFGMAAGHLVFLRRLSELRARFAWRVWSFLSVLLFVAAVEVPPLFGRTLPFYQLDFFAGVAAALLLVWLCLAPQSRLRQFLSAPIWVQIGGFSYSLYLLHAPLIQIVWQSGVSRLGNPRLQFGVLLLVSLPLTLLVSYLFYLVFERPFLPRERRV